MHPRGPPPFFPSLPFNATLKFWRHPFINLILNFVVGIQFFFFSFQLLGSIYAFFQSNQLDVQCMVIARKELAKFPFNAPWINGGHPTNVLNNVVQMKGISIHIIFIPKVCRGALPKLCSLFENKVCINFGVHRWISSHHSLEPKLVGYVYC
jgi:hypothetical protein